MNKTIIQKLNEIESKENVRILLAVESGSRAWGFASTDSDYDVRFIYVHPKAFYLKLEDTRDVIELPIDDVLDISGWDLDKTLKLLYRSNPSLFEWFSSPIVYMETEFAERFRPIMKRYFSSKKGLYHYLSMAKSNYREYLKGDTVIAKKYFYVLRPVLACRWILENGTPPPMLFAELAEAELPDELRNSVDSLLNIKMNQPEIRVIPKIEEINLYLEKSIGEIETLISALPDDKSNNWEELNSLFLAELNRI